MAAVKDVVSGNYLLKNEMFSICQSLISQLQEPKAKNWEDVKLNLKLIIRLAWKSDQSTNVRNNEMMFAVFQFLQTVLEKNDSKIGIQAVLTSKTRLLFQLMLKSSVFELPKYSPDISRQFLELASSLYFRANLLLDSETSKLHSSAIIKNGRKNTLKMLLHATSAFLHGSNGELHLDFDRESEICWQLCNGLVIFNNESAGTKHSFKKTPTFTEVDGMPSRDIFTVLSLSSNYTNDILVSVHAFSALRSWLLYILEKPDGVEYLNIQSNKITSRLSDTNSKHEGSPLPVSGSHFYRDLSSDSETGSCSSLVSSMASFSVSAYNDIERKNSIKRSVTQQSLLTSDSRSQTPIYNRTKQFDSVSITSEILSNASSLESLIIRYCLRIISQSERVPKRDQDRSIITSSVVECIKILHLLCREDSFASQKIYREMRRLYNRIEKEPLAARRVYKSLIEFFIQHHQEVLFPIEDILEHYLREVPSKYYHKGTDSFELIHLLTNNKQYFREKFQIVSKFLPNILKLIVWWPLVFIENFQDIVRVLLTKQNFLEMFHAILDAPCLVTLMHLKHEKLLEDDAKLKEIFKVEFKPYFRIMFAFILRSESTGVDTIDKLKHLYDALEPLKQLPRLKYVTNIVPLLLLHYFDSLYNMHDNNLLRNLYPVILERMFLFYPYSDGNLEVHEILFRQLSYISKLIPDVIHQHFEDVLAFLNRIQYSELYIPQLVCKFIYSLGESLTNGSCTGEEVYKFYEQLETIIYESSQKLGSSNNMSHPEVICSLACSIAKFSAHSQELVQRSLVCLDKILLINYATVSDSISYEDFIAVQTVAYQKIKVLQKPNVAAALLCGLERETPWHLDSTSSPTLKVHYLLRNSSSD